MFKSVVHSLLFTRLTTPYGTTLFTPPSSVAVHTYFQATVKRGRIRMPGASAFTESSLLLMFIHYSLQYFVFCKRKLSSCGKSKKKEESPTFHETEPSEAHRGIG